MDFTQFLKDDRFVIFLFHGVIHKNNYKIRNYTKKHLEVDYFADILRQLRQAGNPVSLDSIAEAKVAGQDLAPRSFGVTFDDGFLNNLTVAAPVLADFQIPATFYVTSDFIQSNRMSWVDRIEWAVEQTPSGQLALPWDGATNFATIEEKQRLLNEIRRHVKSDPAIKVDDFASACQAQLQLPDTWSSDDPLDQKMNWNQVAELHTHPLFTVGGHSHTHQNLAFLDETALDQELDLSISLLSKKAGIRSHHYSYPEGLAHCFSETVIMKLKDRGITICPTAIDGDNDRHTDLFHLRRIMAV